MKGSTLLTLGLAIAALSMIFACGGAAPEPPATSSPIPASTAPLPTTAPPTGIGAGDLDGQVVFGSGGCGACHTIEGVFTGLVGPDLTHIGTDAATRIPGVSAKEYLTESIRDPEAFVPEGVARALPGVMTASLSANLSDDEVNALVEYLLAQK